MREPRNQARCPARKPRHGGSHRRFGRKFQLEAEPSTTRGDNRSPNEAVVEGLLAGLNYREIHREAVALRILKTGKCNGKHGLVIYDFRVEGVFLESVEGDGLDKLETIEFVRQRYGFVVVLITGAMLAEFKDKPQKLKNLIGAAKAEQAVLRAGKSDAPAREAIRATRQRRAQRRKDVKAEQRKRNNATSPQPKQSNCNFGQMRGLIAAGLAYKLDRRHLTSA